METNSFLIRLGQIVRDKREALGYSQESFAEVVELHRTYIGSIERGERNFTLRNFLKVALALNLKPSALMGEVEATL